MKSEVYVRDRKAWRRWLIKYHEKAPEAWLIFYKKHTAKPTISYADSVEEAICFGWIDGLKKSIDSDRYAYRFTPRRNASKWSPLNIKLAKKMIDEGRMSEAGLAAFNRRVTYDKETLRSRHADEAVLKPEIENHLKSNKKAWINFNNLPPGYRNQYVRWLCSAKRPETIAKRLSEAVELLEKNRRLGMK
ncbi:MAG: YdeI/OmpD-associated family protein [Candidatus Thiodiazotropha sp. (ex Epidulcina cf. delphinae)]|nr:YdeI/OmpD-associated family protein [Candidatus Thiodiazotropha sp. (ex Epidulcina cf. delphinae)]